MRLSIIIPVFRTENTLLNDLDRAGSLECAVLDRHIASADVAEPQRVGIIGRYLVFVSVEGAAVQRETVGKETAILNPNAVEGAVVKQNGLYGAVIKSAAEVSAVRPAGVHTEIAVHGEVFGKYNIGGIRNAECNGVRIALIQSAFRILID